MLINKMLIDLVQLILNNSLTDSLKCVSFGFFLKRGTNGSFNVDSWLSRILKKLS